MYAKRIPKELAVTTTEDPCNLVDRFLFIWTSMTGLDAGIKRAWQKMSTQMSKKASMEKREDEAMDGDGVFTMKTHEKKLMEQFACKWAYGCKTW